MESVSNTTAEVTSTVMDCDGNTDAFQKVVSKKSHKRKRDSSEVNMQEEDSLAAKRPQFPALSGDQLKVITVSSTVNTVYMSRLIPNTGNCDTMYLHLTSERMNLLSRIFLMKWSNGFRTIDSV